jgi:hypothetical protein
MAAFKSVMKIYRFTVRHPQTNEVKLVIHPAANLELALKVLAIKCGDQILTRIISTEVRA